MSCCIRFCHSCKISILSLTLQAMDMIFDPLRRIQVPLTPEEGVRQGVISWLRDEMGIPEVMMASEYGFRFNGRQYRADVVAFGRDASPLLLVECKAPGVKLDRNVLEQGIRYNRVLNVRYMMFTNGEQMYVCERVGQGPEYRFLREIPKIQI